MKYRKDLKSRMNIKNRLSSHKKAVARILFGVICAVTICAINLHGENIHPNASKNSVHASEETATTTIVTTPAKQNAAKKVTETPVEKSTTTTKTTKSTTSATSKSETTTTTVTTPAVTEPVTETTPVTTQPVAVPAPNCFAAIGYTPTAEEMNMFCTVVSSETGYYDDAAQKAVAHTIINRVLSDAFPNNIYDVVTQYNQYTAIHSHFDGNYRPMLEPGSELWNNSMRLCYEAMSEYDFTNGAVAYYNPDMMEYSDWFKSLTLVYTDQYGQFFKI